MRPLIVQDVQHPRQTSRSRSYYEFRQGYLRSHTPRRVYLATSVCFPVHSVPIVTKPCSTAQMEKDPLPPISRVKPCMVAVVMLAFSVSTRYPRSPFAILKFAIVNPMGTNELFVGDRAEYVSRRRSYPVLRNRY